MCGRGEGHDREELGCAKIMWSADIFPIRLELMYRQYYGDTSKAANPFCGARLKIAVVDVLE